MNASYGRDLDLNLLRVFAVVADTGSVTGAAATLYLTQPAVSAALRRLTTTIGKKLFVRRGRGLELTSRGQALLDDIRPHLTPLVDAALATPEFDAKTSDRVLKLGLSDAGEPLLLPPLLHELERHAPEMRLVVLPIQFRTVAEALSARRIDMAVTVADELPPTILRTSLFSGGFVCLFDPRHTSIKKSIGEKAYFEHHHVIVSYAGDLRGIVEDLLHKTRRVRCAVSSFSNVGAVVEGSALLATVPSMVAAQIQKMHPHLRTARLPFSLDGASTELLWPAALDDDQACRFVREKIIRILSRGKRSTP